MASIAFNAAALVRQFGRRSAAAAAMTDAWRDAFVHPGSAAQQSGETAVGFEHRALESYYERVVAQLVLHFLSPGERVTWSNAAFLRAGNFTNFLDVPDDAAEETCPPVYAAALDKLARQVSRFTFGEMPVDALKALHHDLFSSERRHAGGEYYTPDWLARYVLSGAGYDGRRSVLDPTCGSGTFLVLALRQALQHHSPQTALPHIAGIDVNPLAVLTAKANLIFALGKQPQPVSLPVFRRDIFDDAATTRQFDFVVGNPPWLNLENLKSEERQRILPLWKHYGLFPHGGMNSILGTSKKDISMLITCVVADRYLCPGGRLGFVLPLSLFKSGGAGAGFRRFQTGTMALRVWQVDDLSAFQPFSGAAAPGAVMFAEKGSSTRYPVTYRQWSLRRAGRIPDEYSGALEDIVQFEEVEAQPAVASDVTSPWMTGRRATLNAVEKLYGKSDYVAHAGAYTGGANSVYWLDILEHLPDGTLHVRNRVENAKLPVPQVEAIIEADLVYPLLRGSDVRRWSAAPGAHILLAQNPHTRRGYDTDWLREHYPLTYAYLAQFEDRLRGRSTYRRYFRDNVPFYTMFDVGMYTLSPVKVVWQGMGMAEMRAAVVRSENQRPVIPNQAMHPFIGLEDEDEAHYLAACLNSVPFELAVLRHSQPRGKSFAQPGILKILRLPRFNPHNETHQTLAALSRQAHVSPGDAQGTEAQIAGVAAALWEISRGELQEIQQQRERYPLPRR